MSELTSAIVADAVTSEGIVTISKQQPDHLQIALLVALCLSALLVLAIAAVGITISRKQRPTACLGLLRIMITLNITAMICTPLLALRYWLCVAATMPPADSRAAMAAVNGAEAVFPFLLWLLLTSANIVAIQLIQTIRRVKECQTADPGVNPSVGERM
jgi:hypothetical protein